MAINLTQEFTFETDTIESLETVLCTVVPILFRRGSGSRICVQPARGVAPGANEHPSTTAAWSLRRNHGGVDAWRESPDAQQPLYWPVCGLTLNWSHTTEPSFASAQEATEEALSRLRAASPEEFWERSRGGRSVFTGDGSVRPGFRAHWSTLSDVLALGLCHIYYFK
jgi:hypothetical protein